MWFHQKLLKLQSFKNYKKLVTNLLPTTARIVQRKNNQAKLRHWNVWKKATADDRTSYYNGLVLMKLAGKNQNKYTLNLLSKISNT